MKLWMFILVGAMIVFLATATISCKEYGEEEEDKECGGRVKTDDTDEMGKAAFIDCDSDAPITLQLNDPESAVAYVPGINVQFHDYPDVGLFLVEDPKGVYPPRAIIVENCNADMCMITKGLLEEKGSHDLINEDGDEQIIEDAFVALTDHIIESDAEKACRSRDDVETDEDMQLWIATISGLNILAESRSFETVMEAFVNDQAIDESDIPDCFEVYTIEPEDPIQTNLYFLKPGDCC